MLNLNLEVKNDIYKLIIKYSYNEHKLLKIIKLLFM